MVAHVGENPSYAVTVDEHCPRVGERVNVEIQRLACREEVFLNHGHEPWFGFNVFIRHSFLPSIVSASGRFWERNRMDCVPLSDTVFRVRSNGR